MIRANVTKQLFILLSEHTFVVPNSPEMCCISTFNGTNYITSSEHEIRIYDNSDKLLSKTSMTNIDLTRTYRLVATHPNSYIVVAINGINTVSIDNDITLTGTNIYAGTFIIKHKT